MRALIRKFILWALAGAPAPAHDPAALDEIASEQRQSP